MLINEFRGVGRITNKEFVKRKTINNDDVIYFSVAINKKGSQPVYLECALYGQLTDVLIKYGKDNPIIAFMGELRTRDSMKNGVRIKQYIINIKEFQLFRNLDYNQINSENDFNKDEFTKAFDSFQLLDEKTVEKIAGKD